MDDLTKTYLDDAGVRTLWAAIKAELVKKMDKDTIQEDYLTADEIESAILTALTDYTTSEQVTFAITTALAGITQFKFEVVDAIPTSGSSNIIYLVPTEGSSNNSFDEYAWINGAPELIGSTNIDMSQYWSKADLRAMTSSELTEILV